MRAPQLSVATVTVAWIVVLWGAAVFLTPGRIRPNSGVDIFLVGCVAVLVPITFIAVARYFSEAWMRVKEAPNRPAYIIWLGFESSIALLIVGAMICGIFFTLLKGLFR